MSLSVFLWFWQKFPVEINLDHDLLIAALLAGFTAGFGSTLFTAQAEPLVGPTSLPAFSKNTLGLAYRSLLLLMLQSYSSR